MGPYAFLVSLIIGSKSVITRQAQVALRRVPLNCLRISWLNLGSRDLGGGLLNFFCSVRTHQH
jgi:hypothetical protein